MNALKKVDSSTKDDNTSKGNASSKDNQVITSTTKNDKKQSSTAKTGDETNIILFVLMAFMSWLGIKKVKKEEYVNNKDNKGKEKRACTNKL